MEDSQVWNVPFGDPNAPDTSWTPSTSVSLTHHTEERVTMRLTVGNSNSSQNGDRDRTDEEPEEMSSNIEQELREVCPYPESMSQYNGTMTQYMTIHEQRTSVIGLREDWDDWPEFLIEADIEDNRMCFLSRPAVRKFLSKFLNEARKMQGWEFFEYPVNTGEFHDYPSYVKRPLCFDDIDRELDHLHYNGLDIHPPRPNLPPSVGTLKERGGRLYLRTVRDFLHAWNQVWVNCHLYTSDRKAPVRQYAYVISRRMKERWERHYQHRVAKQRCDAEGNDYCCACGTGVIAEDGSNNIVFCGSERRGCGKPFHQLCPGGCGVNVPQADWLCDECVECGVPKFSTGHLNPPEVPISLERKQETVKVRRLVLSPTLTFTDVDPSSIETPLTESHRGLPVKRMWNDDLGYIDVEDRGDDYLVGLNVELPHYQVSYVRPQIGWVTTDTQFSRLSKEDQDAALKSTVRLGFKLADEDVSPERMEELKQEFEATRRRNEDLLEETRRCGRDTPVIHPESFSIADDHSIVNIVRVCGASDSPEWICYNITHVCEPCYKRNLVEQNSLLRRVRKLVDLGRSNELPIFGRDSDPQEVVRQLHIHDPEVPAVQRDVDHKKKIDRRYRAPGSKTSRSTPREDGSSRKSSRLNSHLDSIDFEKANPLDFVQRYKSDSSTGKHSQGLPDSFWKELGLFDKFTVLPLDRDEKKLASAISSLYSNGNVESS